MTMLILTFGQLAYFTGEGHSPVSPDLPVDEGIRWNDRVA